MKILPKLSLIFNAKKFWSVSLYLILYLNLPYFQEGLLHHHSALQIFPKFISHHVPTEMQTAPEIL